MKNYITHLEFIIAILSISLLLFSSCDSKNNKHIQPSKETMDSGTVEVYYEDTYSDVLENNFKEYNKSYPKATLVPQKANARNVLAHLLSGKTRVAILGRDNLPDEDSLMSLYNVEPYYKMELANDALVFFTNVDFPIDTLNDEIIFKVLTENKKFTSFLPKLETEPELAIAHQNSSEYGNLINLAAKRKEIKRYINLLPNSDSVLSFVKHNPNAIGICYLSQVQGEFFKLLRIGYTDTTGKYIKATKPVHQSYVIMGEDPFKTTLRLYLLEDRKNLPFWFGVFLEKEAISVKTYEKARLIPCYAKYHLEDWRKQ